MSDPLRDIAPSKDESLSEEAKFWKNELSLAQKREKKWRKEAETTVQLYEGGRPAENNFNILYTNTETMLPAVYSQLPRPIVDRRFKDEDPIGKAAGETLQRTLSYLMDCPDARYEHFSSLIEQAVLGALVPGRGITRFYYEPEFADLPPALGNPAAEGDEAAEGDYGGAAAGRKTGGVQPSGQGGKPLRGRSDDADSKEADAGEPPEPSKPDEIFTEPGRKVTYETVRGEDVDYDGFLMGFARRWADVPWIAYHHAMTKDDLEANFGEEIAKEIDVTPPGRTGADGWKKDDDTDEGESNRGSLYTADVYEIWSKTDRSVVFFADKYEKKVIKTLDDPLGLTGFYPQPAPLQFLKKRSGMVPTTLYTLYKTQAKELNELSRRISKVSAAIKVRGFYDSTLQGIGDLLKKDDNELIPAKNVAALASGQGQALDKAIWLMPIEDLVMVLGKLFEAREACKNVIYEIMGMADIMRGVTQASETATAQNIKDRWGSLRVKRMQQYVAEYVRDCLRIMGEIAGEHFAPETFKAMTGLDYLSEEDVQQAATAALPPPTPPGQGPMPAGPPPGPPGMEAEPPAGGPGMPQPGLPPAASFSGMEAGPPAGPAPMPPKPKWSEVVAVLSNDLQRSYKIDIETNSTIDATSQEDKQNINEAMSTLASMFDSFIPAVQVGIMTPAALKMLALSITRRFEFGRQVEDAVMAMPDQFSPPPPGPDPKQLEQQMAQIQQEGEKLKQEELALKQDKAEFDLQRKEFEMEKQLAQKEMQLAGQKQMADLEGRMQKHEASIAEMHNAANLKMQQDSIGSQADTFRMEGASKAQSANNQNTGQLRQVLSGVQQSNVATQKMLQQLLQTIGQIGQAKGPRKMQVVPQRGPDGRATRYDITE